ncbi:MAG: PucR family transcriptional regulator ligand-binding domain-containing protein [Clostridia bacterium]|nr:PucR family transcriptional regulator ligand-binding domain-containing protein [Clostridia bacterium]
MIRETGIEVREVLEKSIFKNSRVLAGAGGLNNRIVKVNVLVDPDILKFVKEGEFLLTTAYYFTTTTLEEQKKLINELAHHKLSGIGIKVKPHLKALAKEILELADELNLPFIEIDHEISFTDVMASLYSDIFDQQSHVIRKVEKVHNDSMNTVLKGGGMVDIIEGLSSTLGNPIMVKDLHFEEFVFSKQADEQQRELMVESINKVKKDYSKMLSDGHTVIDNQTFDERSVDRVIVPILVKNSIYGYLSVYGLQKEVSSFDSLYLESVSPIVAMEFIKKISVQEVENKYKSEFFEDLISLDERRKAKAIERASYYRLDKKAYYNILSIKFENIADLSGDDYSQSITKAMYLIDLICKDLGNVYLRANKGKKVYVLMMWHEMNDEQGRKFKELAERINEVLSNKIQTLKTRVGLGRTYLGIDNVYKSLKDSEKAIEASKTYIESDVIEFETLGIYKIFCQDNLKEELVSFYNATLKPLVDYDRKRDTELVKSLIVYFETNGNLKKMSELLFTHYNTVLYRINRIQEITNKNLEAERDRYGLQTALKIMKILDL